MLIDLLESSKTIGLCPMGTHGTIDQSLKCGRSYQNQCCFSEIKSVNNNLIARLSVVYLTICILHCDKDFYKYTRKLDFNVEPAIKCCLHF